MFTERTKSGSATIWNAPRLAAWLVAALVGLGSILLYRHTLSFGFVMLDDDVNLVFNPHHGSLSWDRLQWMWTDYSYVRRYIPVGWMGFAVLYELFGLDATGYHAALVTVHAANAVLLFFLVWKLQQRVVGAEQVGCWGVIASGLVAALWSVNPLAVEPTVWASGMLYAQAIFFCLAAMLVYFSGEDGSSHGGWRNARWVVALILYGCSLLTYPVALGLMPAMLGADWWLTRKRRRLSVSTSSGQRSPLLREYGGFLVLAGLVLSATVYSRYQASAAWGSAPSLSSFSLSARVAQACDVLVYYLWKPWLPTGLSPVYTTYVSIDPFTPRFMMAIAIVLLVGSVALCWRKFRVRFTPLLGFYLILMVPFLGLSEQPHIHYDRYALLPGIFWAGLGAVGLLSFRASHHRWIAAFIGLGAVTVSAVLTWRQSWVWRDSISLYSRVAAQLKATEMPLLQYRRLGFILETYGRREEAQALIARGLKLFPHDEFVQRTAKDFFERVEYNRGRAEQAGADVIPLSVQHLDAGIAFIRRGHWREGEEHFRAALAISPGYYLAAYNRALSLVELGRLPEALHNFFRAQAQAGENLSLEHQRAFFERLARRAELEGNSGLAVLARRRSSAN